MKTSLKIFLLAAALIVMSGCSAQRRAERHMRKAVSLCPELVQLKAHPIDTVLTVVSWADCTDVAMGDLTAGETHYTATPHGTIVVSLRKADSTLRVGFIAAPQRIRYHDTIRYSQVTLTDAPEAEPEPARVWRGVGLVLLGIVAGFVILILIALKVKIVE